MKRFVTGIFAMAASFAVVLPAQAQQAATRPASHQQYEEQLSLELLDTMSGSVRKRRSISSDEVRVIVALVRKPASSVRVRLAALKPLTYLRSASITPEQERLLAPMVDETLRRDDTAEDPDGLVKFYALDAAARLPNFKRSALVSAVRALENDKREMVHTGARFALRQTN